MDCDLSIVGTWDVVLYLGVLYHMSRSRWRAAPRGGHHARAGDHRDRGDVHSQPSRGAMALLSRRRTEPRSLKLVGSNIKALTGLVGAAGFSDVEIIAGEPVRPSRPATPAITTVRLYARSSRSTNRMRNDCEACGSPKSSRQDGRSRVAGVMVAARRYASRPMGRGTTGCRNSMHTTVAVSWPRLIVPIARRMLRPPLAIDPARDGRQRLPSRSDQVFCERRIGCQSHCLS